MNKWKSSHFFRKLRTVQTPTKTGQHTLEQRAGQGSTWTSEWDTTNPAWCPCCHPPSSSPPSAPLAAPQLLTACDNLHCTCLKLAELEKAVLLGWVAPALSALPPAGILPCWSIPWRQRAHLLPFLLLIPKPPTLITQATTQAASCKPMWFPVLSQLCFSLSSSEVEHGRRGSPTWDVSFIHLLAGHRKQRLQNK